jgi:nickel/cobalt exporter
VKLHAEQQAKGIVAALLLLSVLVVSNVSRADTVASLLGNFTINQYCGLHVAAGSVRLHYVVVFGQLPALRELHLADADGNGVTSQTERDAYVGQLVPGFANDFDLRVDGAPVPLRPVQWTSSLPTEQGGFSLRIDVDFAAPLPAAIGSARSLEFSNQNYAGRMGWHEIVVQGAADVAVFDTNAYSTSLTGGLTDALQSLPSAGPLDERSVRMTISARAPPHATLLAARGEGTAARANTVAVKSNEDSVTAAEGAWITRHTRQLVEAISGPRLAPQVTALALLGALLLGAVHALSPGHGKTIVGAYLIGSRGTPRHAVFLGLTVTVTHTIGVFALGFATLYASRFMVPERLFPVLNLISAVLVLGMGVILLFQRGRVARRALSKSRSMGETVFYPVGQLASAAAHRSIMAPAAQWADPTLHSHGGGPPHSHLPPGAAAEKVTWRSLLTLGISGGLVPCPSALVLLLAAVALNKIAYGMLLVLAFSIGLAITLTLIGLTFLYARNRFRRPSVDARWPSLLPVLSAGTITALGIALCLGAVNGFSSGVRPAFLSECRVSSASTPQTKA